MPESIAQNPSAPRPAATIIPVRPGVAGLEVFMARRVPGGAFGGVFVFPGGSVQADDYLPDDADFSEAEAGRGLSERGGTPPADAALARALYRAAVRELFEEAGILLARRVSGGPAPGEAPGEVNWESLRAALQARQTDFAAMLRAGGVVPDYLQVVYFSHWITPPSEPRRFDTRFFVAAVPSDQVATHAPGELTESLWISPAAALARAESGQFPIVFPTRQHMIRLARFSSLSALLDFAGTKMVRTVEATREVVDGVVRIHLPEEIKECW